MYSCGSFSAIASDLGTNVSVGRYTEIATGCTRIGFRHPIESVSINSAVFNFYRENVYSYFEKYEKENGVVEKKSVPTPQPQRGTIKIGNDVWIGNNVVLTGNITIGDGAVICSNAVVTKDVPAYSVCGGVPARVLKYRFSEKICEELIKSRWFDYELGDMFKNKLDFSFPELFLEKFNENKEKLRKLDIETFSPYRYMIHKLNNADIKNMIITHHATVMVVDLHDLKIKHILLKGILKNQTPILCYKKDNGFILKFGNEMYVRKIVGDKICISHDECICESIICDDDVLSFVHEDTFLSARMNGVFGLMKHKKEWENFIVI